MNRMGLVGIALALVGVAVLVGYAQTASAIDTGEKFTLVAPVTDERGAQRPEHGRSVRVRRASPESRRGRASAVPSMGVCTTTKHAGR
jgi:hypothetical protein